MAKYERGKIVTGTITCIEPYGAFVSFDEYYTGLIHISEISKGFVRDIHSFINVGDRINVEILDIDEETAHLKLSIKNIKYRIRKNKIRHKIIETPHGFSTLKRNLPHWIEKSLKKSKITPNSVDKTND